MRKILLISLVMGLLAVSLTFAAGSREEEGVTVAEGGQGSSNEAPELAALVDAGELPALAERLPIPADVMVEDMDSIGQYGGNLRMTWAGQPNRWIAECATEEAMFRFKDDGSGEVEPNVAKGVDVNADSTEFIIYLREGMKWSDGVDFTAEDVVFFYNEMLLKETVSSKLRDCFYANSPYTNTATPAVVTKIDDYTVRVTFVSPSPLFLERLAIDSKWFFAPKHYYENLLPHIIGQEAALAKAQEMGYDNTAIMGKETGYYYWTLLGRPVLRPWVASNSTDDEIYILTRNPYYWKVDADGNQLPYINNIYYVKVTADDQHVLKMLGGESDFAFFGFDQYAILKENESSGVYRMTTWPGTAWSGAPFQLNQSVKDEELRAIFQDVRFREALSICVDRDVIVDIVGEGLTEPTQSSVPLGLAGYSDEWRDKWTEYDPERAIALLKEIGFTVDSDGDLLLPSGKPFVLDMQAGDPAASGPMAMFAELLIKYFGDIGISTTFRVYSNTLLAEKLASNDHTAIVAPNNKMSPLNIILRPDTVVPVRRYPYWAGDYGTYGATDGAEGMEPTGAIMELWQLWKDVKSAVAKEDMFAIGQDMIELHEENIWEIGYMSSNPLIIVYNAKLRNVPDSRIFCDEFRLHGIARLQQFYFEN